MADGSSTNEGIQQYYVTKIEEHQVGMIQIDPGSKLSFVSISYNFWCALFRLYRPWSFFSCQFQRRHRTWGGWKRREMNSTLKVSLVGVGSKPTFQMFPLLGHFVMSSLPYAKTEGEVWYIFITWMMSPVYLVDGVDSSLIPTPCRDKNLTVLHV